MLMMC